MLRRIISTLMTLVLLGLVFDLLGSAEAQAGYNPAVQTPQLLYQEARTVHLANLARRAHGVPPLRWNLQLTHAARWYSWDSTERRRPGFCGHDDTLGRAPWDRGTIFGYRGSLWAENAFCGYASPEAAIRGWMDSPGHRENLLDPYSREIGLGYYLRESDGRGYITQDFGYDPIFAPVIIEDEAISTSCNTVNLYVYDRPTKGGFAGLAKSIRMLVSNSPDFEGAAWEVYNARKAWTLPMGEGWRKVYVKTHDRFNRALTVSDSIYLGAHVPLKELGAAQMATTRSRVTLYNLDGGALPQVQFSPGWLADDTSDTFTKWWGNGERIRDSAARGGTAYRLYPGEGESFAWVWDIAFVKNTPLVAYFRLKVSDNTSGNEVARVSVTGGGVEYGPLSLRGTDFAAPDQYQEFPLDFTFNSNPEDTFLIFNFWRTGGADLYVDAVTIFTAPRAISSPLTWPVPGKNYRGQGIWVRYTDGSRFSTISEADTTPPAISGNAGVAGAVLSYTDGADKKVIADGSGNYSITVSYGWSGTIMPSHPCFVFTPVGLTYENVTDRITRQNYAALASGTCASSTFSSYGPHDGWILESSETSSQGGSRDGTASTLILGDDAADRQYRAILSFDTSSLPDDAVITSATLQIRRQAKVGTNPFATHHALLADVRKGSFGLSFLQLGDFQSTASLNSGAALCNPVPTQGWYRATLSSLALPRINKTGVTQFRLRFAKDDNDDRSADYLRFYSGNAPAAYRPVLVIEYYIP